jgi:7,8-dihydro-6-hydroxymethylpterin-pyrophosphokinase
MKRSFVLLPLNDIAPDRKLPGEENTFSQALESLGYQKYKLIQYAIDK